MESPIRESALVICLLHIFTLAFDKFGELPRKTFDSGGCRIVMTMHLAGSG
jgi:hypothetical protein